MELIVLRGETEITVRAERSAAGWRLRVGEATYEIDAAPLGPGARSLRIDGRQFEVAVVAQGGGRYAVSAAGATETLTVEDPLRRLAEKSHPRAAAGPETVVASMPGRVVAILAEEDAAVAAGEGVVVVEAMKMENEIHSERGGRVRRLFVSVGEAVETGDRLFEIDTLPGAAAR